MKRFGDAAAVLLRQDQFGKCVGRQRLIKPLLRLDPLHD
jgi:hypothetical protein